MSREADDNPPLDARRAKEGVLQLAVTVHGHRVGTLAQTRDGLAAFEYDPAWLSNGFSISPISLPLRPGVFIPEREPFDGLFGVFQDSLPDGWGALLLARMLRKYGVEPGEVSPMTMLSLVGSAGRGALCYTPEIAADGQSAIDDLDAFSHSCQAILDDRPTNDLDEVYAAGGSSAGARPKAYIVLNGKEWLVKFPSTMDPAKIGAMEYAYSIAAQDCGIIMSPTRLLPSKSCEGFFATRRFDRDEQGSGIHMLTASGLLEISHRFPVLDYEHLFQATQMLTSNLEQSWQLFRLMCFNAYAHNQDDHSNNFAWLYENGWRLSPAYDLTYSTSFGNEHSTTVCGSGRPSTSDLLALGEKAGLPKKKAKDVAAEIEARCAELLNDLALTPASR